MIIPCSSPSQLRCCEVVLERPRCRSSQCREKELITCVRECLVFCSLDAIQSNLRPHETARISVVVPLPARSVLRRTSTRTSTSWPLGTHATGPPFLPFSPWPGASQRPEDSALRRTGGQRANCCRAHGTSQQAVAGQVVRASAALHMGPPAGLRAHGSDL